LLLPLGLAITALVISLRTRRDLEQEVGRLERLLKMAVMETALRPAAKPMSQAASDPSLSDPSLAAAAITTSITVPAHTELDGLKPDLPDNAINKNPDPSYSKLSTSAETALSVAGDQRSKSSDHDRPHWPDSSPFRPHAKPQPKPSSATKHPLLEPDEQSLSVVTSVWQSFLHWFKGGNAIVRIGVIVLLVGVVLLLRLANELITIPIEVRLGAVAVGGVVLTLIGLKLREKRRSYALSLQGAGLAIVYFTLFAAFRLYEVLPASLTFALLAILAILSAALALMQNALPLALLAFGGGFLAPLLTSTGSNNLVGLFSYYLLLNLALAWMAHYKTWKVLNVLGAFITFGMAGYLGWDSYEASMRWPLEALLLAHLALYLFIAVRYSQQLVNASVSQTMSIFAGGSSAAPTSIAAVDSTLLFGVPLMGFALQSGLLYDIPYALALSSAALSALYIMLGYRLLKHNQKLVLLTEGVLALGIGFMALVLPLALNAQWTAVGWSVQGAALIWLGQRQGRIWSIRSGVALEILSTFALLWLYFDHKSLWLPLWVYSVCLFIAALLMRQRQTANATHTADAVNGENNTSPQSGCKIRTVWRSGFLMILWAFIASQISLQQTGDWIIQQGYYYFLLSDLSFSFYPLLFGLVAIGASWRINWPELSQLLKLILLGLTLHVALFWLDYGGLYTQRGLVTLLAVSYVVFGGLVLWRQRQQQPQPQRQHQAIATNLRMEAALWVGGLLIYGSLLGQLYWIKQPIVAMIILPLMLLAALLYARRDEFLSKQVLLNSAVTDSAVTDSAVTDSDVTDFDVSHAVQNSSMPHSSASLWLPQHITRVLQDLSIPVTVALVGWMLMSNGLSTGQLWGLPYIPIINGLDICLIASGLLLYRLSAYLPVTLIKPAQAALGLAAFVSLTGLIIRTLHQWAATPSWDSGAWQVDLVQTNLTIIWTLCALLLTGLASRYGWRQVWLAGIALLIVVVIKLLLVDLSNVGAVARIVSFIGAGLLMLLIGYIAPLPPSATDLDPPKIPPDQS
jgi:uncharacterized membrane protein